MQPAKTVVRVVLPVVMALAGPWACGPNYRYAYDGESAFERCYGLDFDQSIDNTQRTRCWSDWVASYSYGASGERTEYARNRLATLQAPEGRAPGTLPAPATAQRVTVDTAAPGPATAAGNAPPATASLGPGVIVSPAAPATNGAAASAPASAPVASSATAVDVDRQAATPPTDSWRGRVSAGGNPIASPPVSTTAAGSEPPGASCASDCRTSWSAASSRCAGRDAACVARSDEGYRECMRGCF